MKIAVVIRWNLMFTNPGPSGVRSRAIRDEPLWHEERLRLFFRYCLPAVERAALALPDRRDVLVVLACDGARPAEEAELQRRLLEWPLRVRVGTVVGWPPPEAQGDEARLWVRVDSDDLVGPLLLADMAAVVPAMRAARLRYVQPVGGVCWDEDAGRFFEWRNPSPAMFGVLQEPGEPPPPSPHLAVHHGEVAAQALPLRSVPTYWPPHFCMTLHGTDTRRSASPGRNVCNTCGCAWVGEELGGEALALARAAFPQCKARAGNDGQ